MGVKIVDTTLRDGEQRAGIALCIDEKVRIARLLDKIGVYQIEVGIPAMGGSEKASIKKIVELNLKSKVSTWNRIIVEDIKSSLQCGVELIHISAPVSDIQIKEKLNKNKQWVLDNLKRSINFAVKNDAYVTIGLEDASRADFSFLVELIKVASEEGAKQVRYADTVGVLHPRRIFEEIEIIKGQVSVDLEIHAHNDFGMAVANSIAAVRAGVHFVDCTIGGIGERAGNCDYIKFMRAAKACLGIKVGASLEEAEEAQVNILNIIGGE